MFTQTLTRHRPVAPIGLLSLLDLVADRLALYRQRQRLAELPDHLLEDVGLSLREALEEADRPVWDAPEHWRR